MARPKGARNAIPSRAEQRDLIKTLRTGADQGDPLAAGLLLLVTQTLLVAPTRHGQDKV